MLTRFSTQHGSDWTRTQAPGVAEKYLFLTSSCHWWRRNAVVLAGRVLTHELSGCLAPSPENGIERMRRQEYWYCTGKTHECDYKVYGIV